MASAMSRIYLKLVKEKGKKIEDVPEEVRAEVQALLDEEAAAKDKGSSAN